MRDSATADPFLVRPGHPEDVAALARLHVLVWRHAYAGLLAQSVLDSLDVAEREARWRKNLADADSEDRLLRVADHHTDGIVGFAVADPARDEHPPREFELTSLYVHPEHHGGGAAQALSAAVLGERSAYLWVLQGNERAVAFYRKLGFELDGVSKYDGRWDCTDLRMVRG